jgi:hypothetical protein
MLFQSKDIFEDGRPVTCKILDNSKNFWTVEYNDNGVITQVEIDPDSIKSLDYSEFDLSQ